MPQPWTVADVVAIAGLIGGIFGRGGGAEIANAHLLQYLRHQLGRRARHAGVPPVPHVRRPAGGDDGRRQALPVRDPRQGRPAHGGAARLRQADHRRAGRHRARTAISPSPTPTALSIIRGLSALPKHMSNALVVNGDHTASGHPVAVFGPQVSYFAPQILSELDLHSPDYAAEGASFPGTGIVELGRGEDFAWSATSAGSDLIDMRLEKICNPKGGKPAKHGTYYLFRGHCRADAHRALQGDRATRSRAARARRRQLDHVIHLHAARHRAGLDDLARAPGRGRDAALHLRPRRRLGGRLPRAGASRR